MKPIHLLTPLYLDQWREEYQSIAKSGWVINRTPHMAGPDIQHRVLPAYRYIKGFVDQIIRRQQMPVTWNGDCCAALPMLAGLQDAGLNPTLIWFDAHGDFNTWETTESGFLGGMPLAMMTGRGEKTWSKELDLNRLADEQIILLDGRDLDRREADMLGESGVYHLPEVKQLIGWDLGERPIWVHFDVDILRVEDCPATNYPTPGGPSLDEMADAFRYIKASDQLAGLSISMWEPSKAGAKESEAVVMELVDILV